MTHEKKFLGKNCSEFTLFWKPFTNVKFLRFVSKHLARPVNEFFSLVLCFKKDCTTYKAG